MAVADWIRVEHADRSGRAAIAGRRIYILPTRYGLVFGALLFLMLLGAVNYGNNPAHLLTFLLAGLAANAIYLTWRNLRGLLVHCDGAAPVFAGEPARFALRLDGHGDPRPGIQLMFDEGDAVVVDLAAGVAVNLSLPLPELPRGLHPTLRLTVSTRYPLGLFRAWCYVACTQSVLVYPRPGEHWARAGDGGERASGGERGIGSEDFAGLRAYQPGDQPARIDWKSYARARDLHTRLFSGEAPSPLWIDWAQAPGGDTEARLSAMARAILDAETGDLAYGLRTPLATIEPGSGAAHRHRCLRHLALYRQDDV